MSHIAKKNRLTAMRTCMFLFSLPILSNFSLGPIGDGEVMCFQSVGCF